eukprot:363915-Chlamydomonas_euryale.AAC.3
MPPCRASVPPAAALLARTTRMTTSCRWWTYQTRWAWHPSSSRARCDNAGCHTRPAPDWETNLDTSAECKT